MKFKIMNTIDVNPCQILFNNYKYIFTVTALLGRKKNFYKIICKIFM
jgi:hypothetical protein